MPNPNRARATSLIILASVIWGATFVSQKLAGLHVGAFTYNGVRFALGCITLLPVALLLEKSDRAKTRRTVRVGAVLGVVLFAAANLQQLGIVLSDSPSAAGEAGFITGMYTVLVPVFGWALGRKTTAWTWIAAVTAFGGLALISVGPEGLSSARFSDLYTVGGAVFWAFHILIIDRFARDVSPVRLVITQFAVAAVLSMVCAFVFETVSLDGLRAAIWPLLFGGVLASGVAYTLQIFGQRGVEPSRAAVVFSLEAVFAALSEAVWLGEVMTPRKYLGGAVILLGVLLSQFTSRPRSST